MFRKSILVLGSVVFASHAFADQTQYARSAGVQPGAYAVAAISEMRRIAEDGSGDGGDMRLKRLQAKATTVTFAAKNEPSQGRNALAASAGIPAGGVTSHQLHQLLRAQEDREDVVVRRILSDIAGVRSTPAGVSPGRVQIARSLGVNAADHSLAELVRMQVEANYDDAHN